MKHKVDIGTFYLVISYNLLYERFHNIKLDFGLYRKCEEYVALHTVVACASDRSV